MPLLRISNILLCKNSGILVPLVFAAFVLMTFSYSTSAYSASCSHLKRQLASIGKSSSGGSAKYRRAAKQQQRNISKVKRTLRSAGCSVQDRPSTTCNILTNSLQRMRANLARLRNKAGGGSSSKKLRRRIKHAIRRKGCDSKKNRIAKKSRKKLIQKAYGKKSDRRSARKSSRMERDLAKLNRKKGSSKSSKFQARTSSNTVCVRRCDGYFFPINYASIKMSQKEGVAVCNRLCPGTKVDLFYRKKSTQSVGSMKSIDTGERYADLPNAFSYQSRFDPTCTCNNRLLERQVQKDDENNSIIAGVKASQKKIYGVTIPSPRIDRGQHRETVADLARKLAFNAANEPEAKKKNQQKTPKKKKIRVIGDAYFPSQ